MPSSSIDPLNLDFVPINTVTDPKISLVYTNGKEIKHRVHRSFATQWKSATAALARAGCVKIVTSGVNNIRPISGTTTMSAHAFGRAIDINEVLGITMDEAANILRNYFVNVLWQVPAHFDHIHANVQYDPNGPIPEL